MVKTHYRAMVIQPSMIGGVVGVYNGKTFNQVEIKVCMAAAPPSLTLRSLRWWAATWASSASHTSLSSTDVPASEPPTPPASSRSSNAAVCVSWCAKVRGKCNLPVATPDDARRLARGGDAATRDCLALGPGWRSGARNGIAQAAAMLELYAELLTASRAQHPNE